MQCIKCDSVSSRKWRNGLCHNCYENNRRISKPLIQLTYLSCGPVNVKKLTLGLCGKCYAQKMKNSYIKIEKCLKCQEVKSSKFCRDLCQKCYAKTRRIESPEIYIASRTKNKNKISKNSAKWARENPGKKNAKESKRRANKLHAIPKWADLRAIKEFYENCPIGHEVDHIIPLQGKNISGLHVLENLQYLISKLNLVKSNKFDGTIQNESWRA